jgi:hypothetical protein
MEIHWLDVFRFSAALFVGGVIGLGFGVIQNAARLRNERRQQAGKLNDGWSIMPGSGARVAYLLISLVIIQIVCPLLFTAGTQWWVSGGLVAAYGWSLFQNLQGQRKAARI